MTDLYVQYAGQLRDFFKVNGLHVQTRTRDRQGGRGPVVFGAEAG